MKKLLLSFVVALFTVGAINAQDLETVTNLYNAAAEVLSSGDDAAALTQFEAALKAATALGDEGAAIANNCKDVIPKLLVSIGKSCANSGKIDEAIDNFNKAIDVAAEYGNDAVLAEASALIPQMLMANAGQLLNDKKYLEAAAAYKKVVDLDPTNGTAWLRMGMDYAAEGNSNQLAIEALNAAAENGQEANAKKQLATVYLKEAVACQKAKDMAGMLENAQLSAQNNDSANAQKLIGTAALSLKQNKVAADAFEAYLALNPNASDKAQTIYQLATALMGAGDNAKACSYFKQIANDEKWGEAARYYITTLKCN